MLSISDILNGYPTFEKVISNSKPYRRLDFSFTNPALLNVDLSDTSAFATCIFWELLSENTYTGIGGYAENRIIYRLREHFTDDWENPRSIHLGTDIWVEAGEPVYAPLSGRIHSFAFNNRFGDYGPTIILSHSIHGHSFFTLYGHLSLSSLKNLHVGKAISGGQNFASVGTYPENGDWPSHLHFQVITDMGNSSGDFPGVTSAQDSARYLSICPDPNLILRIPENESSVK